MMQGLGEFVFMGGYIFEFFLSECHAVVTAAHTILDKGYRMFYT